MAATVADKAAAFSESALGGAGIGHGGQGEGSAASSGGSGGRRAEGSDSGRSTSNSDPSGGDGPASETNQAQQAPAAGQQPERGQPGKDGADGISGRDGADWSRRSTGGPGHGAFDGRVAAGRTWRGRRRCRCWHERRSGGMTEATQYGDWGKERTGWFLGLSGPQLITVVFSGTPALLALGSQRWVLFVVWMLVWAVIVALTVLPVRGRPAFRWLADLAVVVGGRGTGVDGVCLPRRPGRRRGPGRAGSARGPVRAVDVRRAAVRDRGPVAAGADPGPGRPDTWAVTARIEHPGIGLAEQRDRDRMGWRVG